MRAPGIGRLVGDAVQVRVHLHAGPQAPGAGHLLGLGPSDDLSDREVVALGVLAVQQRRRDPYFVGDADTRHVNSQINVYLVNIVRLANSSNIRFACDAVARSGYSRRMAQPVIGLTLDSEPPGGYSGEPWYAIRENYCTAVAAAGGIPIALPHEPELAERYLETVDGLVITGGAFDVNPALFGAT